MNCMVPPDDRRDDAEGQKADANEPFEYAGLVPLSRANAGEGMDVRRRWRQRNKERAPSFDQLCPPLPVPRQRDAVKSTENKAQKCRECRPKDNQIVKLYPAP